MKKRLFSLLFFLWLTDYPIVAQNPILKRNGIESIIADHTVVAEFKNIPDSILPYLAAIKLMFRHASVGTTINNGLDCIQGTRTNPSVCKEFPAYKYDRRNWAFQPRGNSGWYGKITDFVTEVENQIDSFDIFSFKYCYLEGLDQVAEPCGGANFSPVLVTKAWDSLRTNMERLEAKHPDKLFIWWTIPLTQPGQHCTDTLNKIIRKYVKENGKILFDIADIESWDTNGQQCLSKQGWQMAFSGYCGEAPPGPSCHPNWTGSIMLAKAFWWMMANVYGWLDTSSTSTFAEYPAEKFSCFPNPVKNIVTIVFNLSIASKVTLSVYSPFGKMVKSFNQWDINQKGYYYVKIDVSEFNPGIYFLVLNIGSSRITVKLIKE